MCHVGPPTRRVVGVDFGIVRVWLGMFGLDAGLQGLLKPRHGLIETPDSGISPSCG